MTKYMSLRQAKEVMANEKENNNLDKIMDKINSEVEKVKSIEDIFILLDYNPTSRNRISPVGNRLNNDSNVTKYMGRTDIQKNGHLSRILKDDLEKLSKEYIPDFEYIMNDFNSKGRNVYRKLIKPKVILTSNREEYPNAEEYQEISKDIAKSWSKKMSKSSFAKFGWLSKEKKFQKSKFKIVGEKHSNFAEEVLESLNEGDNLKLFRYNDGQASEVVKNIITIDLSEKNN